jgi:hypothetical protein
MGYYSQTTACSRQRKKARRLGASRVIRVGWQYLLIMAFTATTSVFPHLVKGLDSIQPPAISSMTSVSFQQDEDWWENAIRKGCCPHAKTLHSPIYDNIGNRCCLEPHKLARVNHWRPNGGLSFGDTQVHALLKNKHLRFVGDSLTLQLYAAVLCDAWEHGFHISLRKHPPVPSKSNGLVRANAAIPKLNMSLSYARLTDVDQFCDEYTKAETRRSDVLVGSVTFHSKAGKRMDWSDGSWEPAMHRVLSVLNETRRERRSGITLLSDHYPNNFPGSNKDTIHNYFRNESAPYDKCEQFGELKSRAGFSRMCTAQSIDLVRSISALNAPAIRAFPLFELLNQRSDAHVGQSVMKGGKISILDCFHLCFLPGVLSSIVHLALGIVVKWHLEGA